MRLFSSVVPHLRVVHGLSLEPVLSSSYAARHRAAHHLASPLKTGRFLCSASLSSPAPTRQRSMVASNESTSPKLDELRTLLSKAQDGEGVAAFIIPTEDAHMGEYPPDCDARRVFVTGFTGSAGTAVVTSDAALLWTDGRYFLQAESQLESGWTLMKHGTPGCPEIEDWLAENVPEGSAVGYDPWLHTVAAAEKLEAALTEGGRRLVPLSPNPVDQVWGRARPAAPAAPVAPHALEWAGVAAAEKLADLRRAMAALRASALLVTALDEVAWLLNLRGGDVAHNPVFISYCLVTADAATLFVDGAKLGEAAGAALREAGVGVAAYEAVGDALAAAAAEARRTSTRVWLDPAKVNAALKRVALLALEHGDVETRASPRGKKRRASAGAAGNGAAAGDGGAVGESHPTPPHRVLLERPFPLAAAKGVKNAAELAGMVEAHLRDGVALVTFLAWLEAEVGAGRSLTEVEVDERLTALRAAQPGYRDTSFDTIAGAGPHGAIIHYRAEPATAARVGADTLLLLDSGGQYDCGTTDVTRTMHFGTPSEHQRRCFTRVLRGHIALDTAVYPEGTPGCALDALARAPLWQLGLNYRHGTGHGVGAALNVHEGPQSISGRWHITAGLARGMVCSNEPGYYEDGAFGIRIENLFVVTEAQTPFRFGGQEYLTAQPLTVVPIQKKMMVREEMTADEIAWVDAYHAKVLAALTPRLSGRELEWLKEATLPL
ncbi:hypothetical protein ACKKBG_A26750 [Auxenochlorella protothecoides x Auxenochlorella symbiontica]